MRIYDTTHDHTAVKQNFASGQGAVILGVMRKDVIIPAFNSSPQPGESLLEFLRAGGVDADLLAFARKFIKDLKNVAEQLVPPESHLLREFMHNRSFLEHGIETSIITALLINPLRIASDRTVYIVGMASLFHNIGLFALFPELHHEKEEQMTEEQKALFWTHPTEGAKILDSIDGFDSVTVMAVEKHLNHRFGDQVPRRKLGTPERVAEVIGVSDDFVRLLRRHEDQRQSELPRSALRGEIDRRVLKGVSDAVSHAFHSVFGSIYLEKE